MINYLNQTRPDHIITIEDPVEFMFQADKAIISQREV
jgi:Tfp pilus assembly pilus retraction ATPase PilT